MLKTYSYLYGCHVVGNEVDMPAQESTKRQAQGSHHNSASNLKIPQQIFKCFERLKNL